MSVRKRALDAILTISILRLPMTAIPVNIYIFYDCRKNECKYSTDAENEIANVTMKNKHHTIPNLTMLFFIAKLKCAVLESS